MSDARGKIIVIEGGDASGKATQTALLTERLEAAGQDVVQLDFPRYHSNHVGTLLRECLDGKRGDFMNIDPRITSLLFAADRVESMTQITDWLEAGKVVILDRYTSANMLHQAAKIDDAVLRQETIAWIYTLEHEVFNLPIPDAVVYLAVPAAVRATLLQKQYQASGREIDVAESDMRHQKKVDEYATGVLEMYPRTVTINCAPVNEELRTPEDINAEIYQVLHGILA